MTCYQLPWSIVRDSGCGGFLDPPEYPTHTYSIQEGSRTNPRSIMAIQSDLGSYVPEDIRLRALALLDAWEANRPPLDREDVQAWIHQVLGYFRNCYQGVQTEPECWHVTNLVIDRTADPIVMANTHAGVHLIRKYYPEFTPTDENWQLSRWGKS